MRRKISGSATTLHRIQDERLAGGVAMLIATGALAVAGFAGFGGTGDNGGAAPYAVSLVTCVVFLTGLPFVLGMGAISAGLRANRRLPAAAGALAVVLAAVGCFVG